MSRYDVATRHGFRMFLDPDDGSDPIELVIVRGLDGGAPCPNGSRMFHLFGPASQPLPLRFRTRFEGSPPANAYLDIEVVQDGDGIPCFKPLTAVTRTSN